MLSGHFIPHLFDSGLHQVQSKGTEYQHLTKHNKTNTNIFCFKTTVSFNNARFHEYTDVKSISIKIT